MSQYRLKWIIGQGGMGTVHEARRVLPNGREVRVACKELNVDQREKELAIEMFYRESEINLQVSHNHPGLVTVHDCIKAPDGSLYLVMEFVEGCSVGDLADTYGRLSAGITRYISDAVFDALDYIHDRDVLHRDISPCNILISTSGDVKLSDLGLAKLLHNGQAQSNRFRGKAEYASPEQLRCLPLDARSDLYSVGAVMYEMAMGRPLAGVKRATSNPAVDIVEHERIPLTRGMKRDLRRLTTSLLQIHPRDRPASAHQARRRLRRIRDVDAMRAALAELVTPIYERRAAERQRAYDGRDRIISNQPLIVVNDTEPDSARPDVAPREREASRASQKDREASRITRDALPLPQRASVPVRTRRGSWVGLSVAAAALVALVALGYYGLAALSVGEDSEGTTLQPAQTKRASTSPPVTGPGQLDSPRTTELSQSKPVPYARNAEKSLPMHRHGDHTTPPSPAQSSPPDASAVQATSTGGALTTYIEPE